MVGVAPSPETPSPYIYDRRPVDETLLNAQGLIVRYVDKRPRLPIGEDERFDPAIHSYDTPYGLMSTEERAIGKAAFALLTERYAEISSRIGPAIWEEPVVQVQTMLSGIQTEWLTQYLQTHADKASHIDFAEWAEGVIRYHPNYTLRDEGNTAVSPYYPVYRAYDDLELNIARGNDRLHLPGMLIAPPGITVTTSEGSNCYVARWDDIGTDTPLEIPVNGYIRRELERRGLLQEDTLALSTRAAEIGKALGSH